MPRGACLRLRITTTRARSAAVGLTQRNVSGISALGPFFERDWTTASLDGARGASLSSAGAPDVTLVCAGVAGMSAAGVAPACATGAGAGTALVTVTFSTAVVL